MLSDQSFHNLGIGMNRPTPDVGLEAVTGTIGNISRVC
jgi:hypothetical protein